jgi:hypothetical protein
MGGQCPVHKWKRLDDKPTRARCEYCGREERIKDLLVQYVRDIKEISNWIIKHHNGPVSLTLSEHRVDQLLDDIVTITKYYRELSIQ